MSIRNIFLIDRDALVLRDAGANGPTGGDAKMVYTVPADKGGNYYLEVSKTQADTGTYTVEMTEV